MNSDERFKIIILIIIIIWLLLNEEIEK